MRELQIWRVAQGLIALFGADAAGQAARRAEEAMAEDSEARARSWRGIEAAIRKLTRR
jgi:hypothetical protein